MENSHMVAIGQMVASAGKSLLGGYELENIRGDHFTKVVRELFLPKETQTRWEVIIRVGISRNMVIKF